MGMALKGLIILPKVPPRYATNRHYTAIQQEALVTTTAEPGAAYHFRGAIHSSHYAGGRFGQHR